MTDSSFLTKKQFEHIKRIIKDGQRNYSKFTPAEMTDIFWQYLPNLISEIEQLREVNKILEEHVEEWQHSAWERSTYD